MIKLIKLIENFEYEEQVMLINNEINSINEVIIRLERDYNDNTNKYVNSSEWFSKRNVSLGLRNTKAKLENLKYKLRMKDA